MAELPRPFVTLTDINGNQIQADKINGQYVLAIQDPKAEELLEDVKKKLDRVIELLEQILEEQ